jgi:hypothetical protein
VAATDIYLVDHTEIERIERWRAQELERAGYEPRAAGRLAVRHDVDLHTAIDLLERGCPRDLALSRACGARAESTARDCVDPLTGHRHY